MQKIKPPYIIGTPAPYEEVYRFTEGMACVKTNGKWGYVNTRGEMAIPAVYDEAFNFSAGAACVVRDGKASLIDKQGGVVLATQYKWLEKFKDGYIRVSDNNDLEGCLDPDGNLVVSCKYHIFYGFEGNLSMVSSGSHVYDDNARYGYVNRDGAEVIPLIYHDAESFDGGYAEVCTGEPHYDHDDSKWGLIDTSGNVVIPPEYSGICQHEGLVSFKAGESDESMWGVMDLRSNVIIPAEYDKIYLCGGGVIAAHKDGKRGLFNVDGSQRLPFVYDKLSYWWEKTEMMAAGFDGKTGCIDHSGNVVIPFLYDDVAEFHFGRAAVEINEKYGMIDMRGNIVIPVEYDNILDTCEEFTVAMKDRKIVILRGANPVLPPFDCEISHAFSDGVAWFKTDGLWYAISAKVI